MMLGWGSSWADPWLILLELPPVWSSLSSARSSRRRRRGISSSELFRSSTFNRRELRIDTCNQNQQKGTRYSFVLCPSC